MEATLEQVIERVTEQGHGRQPAIWESEVQRVNNEERIDGLTREQTSVRVHSQERHQSRRQEQLRRNHKAGEHKSEAVKCDLCHRKYA